jgi:formylglycine-generating enzyme
MGNPLIGEQNANELPVHSVNLPDYYIARRETTKAHWDEVRTWGLAHGYTDLRPGSGKAPTHPVCSVSWYDVVKWCNAASEMDRLIPCYYAGGEVYRSGEIEPTFISANNGYRLPTEAEWEKAARGGMSGKRFPWGETISHSQANYQSSLTLTWDLNPTRGHHPTYKIGEFPHTSPGCSFAPNGYGLCDVSGNVSEWCWDWYESSYYSNSPEISPTGPASGTLRVRRGGDWHGYADQCRVYSRGNFYPDSRNNSIGFRLALAATVQSGE